MNYPEAVWCCKPILSGTATTPTGYVWIKWEMEDGRVLIRVIDKDPSKPPKDTVVI